jgi:IclR family acetate operon transcriptional repressor
MQARKDGRCGLEIVRSHEDLEAAGSAPHHGSLDGDELSARSGSVLSLAKALKILDTLSRYDQGLCLSDLARIVELPLSTTHRLLTTLLAQRYAAFDRKSFRWSIGMQAFVVGATFSRARDLVGAGRPVMKVLMEDCRETVNLSMSDNYTLVYASQVEPMHAVSTFTRPGAQVPLYSSAAGKSMMAWWDDKELALYFEEVALTRLTGRTIVDESELRRELAGTRRRGYAVDNEEHTAGTRCVAAPVFDEWEEPVAALSISGPVHRLPPDRTPHLGQQVQKAAARMTELIGGRVRGE